MEPDKRTVVIGTGRQGAIIQVNIFFQTMIVQLYGRKPTDAERALINQLVELETADWPDGWYSIGSTGDFIEYGGMSIFKYMDNKRKAKKN